MQITWLGHSAFEIEDRDHVVVDPFLTGNPKAPKSWEDVACDIIAVTHGHGDHVGDTIDIARKNNAVVVAIHEIAQFFSKLGLQVESMNKGATIHVRNTGLTMTHAIHSSGISGEKTGFSPSRWPLASRHQAASGRASRNARLWNGRGVMTSSGYFTGSDFVRATMRASTLFRSSSFLIVPSPTAPSSSA